MNQQEISDPQMFHILAQLDQWGEPEAPLQIIKENQSYIIGHRRRRYTDGAEYLDPACKLTFLKSRNAWKLFWMRADGKWQSYGMYGDLDDAVQEVRFDPEGCFWG